MIDTLLFGGGASNGISYMGTIRYLDQIGLLPRIKTFCGTSIGSLTAMCLALGYTSHELYAVAHLIDGKRGMTPSGFLSTNGGLDKRTLI